MSFEQAAAEVVLELLNLPADRALTEIELGRRSREASRLGNHRKRLKRLKRRQPALIESRLHVTAPSQIMRKEALKHAGRMATCT
jgi:hypothetical protein